ncbi:hypothetical protein C9374_009530 [Naegleria lovaniensis]|uniref:Uncharacterized protein n=1 Tax=Naegleria lovaniensis TaxID=51637 RepID=A0AA88H1H3_NAELO|nr:uncharacterized protein C9374_009530 [Naegleria lovaniensis]KAG2392953.1 hypothetical protein C9374_009530 [Naegleria lovaniensis]
MTKHTCKKLVPLSKEEYWKLVFTDEFDNFTAPYLKFKKVEPETLPSDNPKIIKRRVKVYPDYEIPSALLWYLGQSEFHYEDQQEKDLENHTLKSVTIPPVHGDYLSISSLQYIEEVDANSCYHVLETEIVCSAWGIGSLVESAICSGVDEGYNLLPKAVEAFIASKKSSPIVVDSNVDTAASVSTI